MIYNKIYSPLATAYWTNIKGTQSGTVRNLEEIDWEAIANTVKEIPRMERALITKHTPSMCGFGKFMQGWKLRESAVYPRCGVHEDAEHVWLCYGCGVDDLWNQSLAHLESWIGKIDIDPDIQARILCGLHQWQDPNSLTERTQQLVGQEMIKCRRLLEGWLHISWREEQQQY